MASLLSCQINGSSSGDFTTLVGGEVGRGGREGEIRRGGEGNQEGREGEGREEEGEQEDGERWC